jgi:hypothetical protein
MPDDLGWIDALTDEQLAEEIARSQRVARWLYLEGSDDA